MMILHIDVKNYSSKPKSEMGLIKSRLQSEGTLKEVEISELAGLIEKVHMKNIHFAHLQYKAKNIAYQAFPQVIDKFPHDI